MSSSSAELTRRPATAADRPFLWRLHRLALRPYVEQTWGWDEAWQCNHFEQRFTPDRKEILYLGGRPIGMIEVEHRADDVFLALIEIDPAHQGRGIGARLIREVIDEAKQGGSRSGSRCSGSTPRGGSTSGSGSRWRGRRRRTC